MPLSSATGDAAEVVARGARDAQDTTRHRAMAHTVVLIDLRGEKATVTAREHSVEVKVGEGEVNLILASYSAKDRVNWADALHSAAKLFEDVVVMDTLKESQP